MGFNLEDKLQALNEFCSKHNLPKIKKSTEYLELVKMKHNFLKETNDLNLFMRLEILIDEYQWCKKK